MWSPGLWELLIILVIVLVIFGAGKLPQVGRSLGSAITEFKESVKTSGDDEDEESTTASTEETAK